jgi:osmoprotectant transport system ATP-binding protein
MRTGKIVQFDTPKKIMGEPADEFVKDFVGKDCGLKLMKLLKISDIMVPALNNITERSGVVEAKRLMEERKSDILLVVDDHEVFQGVIRFELLTNRTQGSVKELMDRDISTVKTEKEIRPTLELMLRKGVVWLPVVDEEERLKGIVTMTHFACFFSPEGWNQEGAS